MSKFGERLKDEVGPILIHFVGAVSLVFSVGLTAQLIKYFLPNKVEHADMIESVFFISVFVLLAVDTLWKLLLRVLRSMRSEWREADESAGQP
jgi:predicted membrane channel-forming protein YqfA (hemolysin III family)